MNMTLYMVAKQAKNTYIAKDVAVQWHLKVPLKILKSELSKFLNTVTYNRKRKNSQRAIPEALH